VNSGFETQTYSENYQHSNIKHGKQQLGILKKYVHDLP